METLILRGADKKRAKLLLTKFTLGSLAFTITAILLIVTLAITFIWPTLFPQDQQFVIIPLLILWLYLLRQYPITLKQLKSDIEQGAISEVNGLSLIHNKPGFKILFAPDVQLSVSDSTFDLLNYSPEHLHIGHQVSAKYFSNAKLLLSVQLADGVEGNTKACSHLNDIELAIVKLMANGEPDKLIARELSLEPATIRTYNSNIYRKLAVKNRKQAAEKAANIGLINVN